MATPISSNMKDKNSIFTVRNEDMIFLVKGKILVFHQYLYNKLVYLMLVAARNTSLLIEVKVFFFKEFFFIISHTQTILLQSERMIIAVNFPI